MKSQGVRLVDVFLLGPLMVWYAAGTRQMPDWARASLGVAGLLTIVYNGRNYLER